MPIVNCDIHSSVKIWHPGIVNLYGCKIGANTKIGSFVEIGNDVIIGKNCMIESHVFIPEGIIIADNIFVGPRTVFTNTLHPMRGEKYRVTTVYEDVVIGAGATILPGLEIGHDAIIGAGAVVTRSVEAGVTVVGNPARPLGKFCKCDQPHPCTIGIGDFNQKVRCDTCDLPIKDWMSR